MTWWHKAALATVPVVGACLCLLLFQASALVERVDRDEGTFAAQIQQALTTVNAECGPVTHCGTLAEVDKTLTHTSDLIVQTQLAVRRADQVSQTEAALLPVWNQRITGTLNGIDTAVGDFDGNQNKLTAAALPVFQQTEKTVADADLVVTSPYITRSLQDLSVGAKAGADSAAQIDATLTDIRVKADELAHPPKKKLGFWGSIWLGAQAIHKLSPPLF